MQFETLEDRTLRSVSPAGAVVEVSAGEQVEISLPAVQRALPAVQHTMLPAVQRVSDFLPAVQTTGGGRIGR